MKLRKIYTLQRRRYQQDLTSQKSEASTVEIAETVEETPNWTKPGLPLKFTFQGPSKRQENQTRPQEIAVMQIL